MPVYLDTRGNSVLSVAVCDRCNRKFPYVDLMPDPNFPGMRVCKDDLDNFDPWRLPARQTENISLRFPRPDVSIATGPVGGTQLMTAEAPNNPNRNSIFINQTQQVATTAGSPGDLTTGGGAQIYPQPIIPIINSCSPNSGSTAGGTNITVVGSNLISITNVKLGGVNATFTAISPTQITVVSPSYAVTGPVDLQLFSTFGNPTLHGAFTYT